MSETTPQSPENRDAELAAKAYADFELPIAGFAGTPEEIEQQWYEKVYLGRGDVLPQLTVRAVIMGSLLGGLLSLTNLYAGLKTGWGFGVSITASILSYAIWTAFYKAGLVRSQMGILETNCMKATSSSAGYSTGGTLISAYAAYMMLNHSTLSIPVLMAWVFFIAVMGVTMAIPMKRQMVNIEQLRFPSGIACAETLKVLYSEGVKGMRAAKALIVSGVFAGCMKFWEEGFKLIRLGNYSLATLQEKINGLLFGSQYQNWTDRTVMFALDPMLLAAGALTGMKVSASMFLGATLCWVVFVPIMQAQGIMPSSPVAYRDIIQWPLWGGVSCMVTSGLLSFFLQWRSIVKAFGNMGKIFSKTDAQTKSEVDRLEAPISWFLLGQFVSLIALAWLSAACFDIPIWQSVLAVFLTFFLALVSCRITGETDTTPIGAMGKVMQLIFGALNPNLGPVANPGLQNINLMAANITAGAASSSGDLLTDLKTGYLLGANPRKQFLAQFCGIFMGTVVTVVSFRMLVPDYTSLGTTQFPAPAAMTWKAVAEAMSEGIGKLHIVKIWLIGVGGLVGILLPLLSKYFPKYNKWIPSPAGLGLSWTFFWHSSLMFFLGALISYGLEKKAPKQAEEYTFPVASGLIAGVALMGVLIAFIENGPEIIKQLIGG
ncbi:MAG: OPT/YSL family transporter [Pirellulales bacterium]|nr:OPT/YSL family transporter [Pirellulales bacterium]